MAERRTRRMFGRLAAVALAASVLAGCNSTDVPKHLRPLPTQLVALMRTVGVAERSPIFIRIFKQESELEVWKQRADGQFALLKTYAICTWSGELGPKLREGDRQSPEGFYTVTPGQMNPNSNYYLSFNIGFPNAYDRSLGRTGQHLMVHGACSSAGCYSMNDEQIAEIFSMARDSFNGGQRSFQVHAFPFRMTPENMAEHRGNPNMPFWRMLKEGYDHFEVTHRVPKVDVCDRRYVFDAEAGTATFDPAATCPAFEVPETIEVAVAAKQAADEQAYTMIAARLDAAAAAATIGAPTAIAAATTPAGTGAVALAAAEPAPPAASLLDRLLGRTATAAPAAPRPSLWARMTGQQPAAAAAVQAAAPGTPAPRPNPDRTAAVVRPAALPGAVAAYQPVDRTALAGRLDDAFAAVLAPPVLTDEAIAARRAAR